MMANHDLASFRFPKRVPPVFMPFHLTTVETIANRLSGRIRISPSGLSTPFTIFSFVFNSVNVFSNIVWLLRVLAHKASRGADVNASGGELAWNVSSLMEAGNLETVHPSLGY